MDTRFFGPPGWKFLHSIANNYANLDWEQIKKEDRIEEVKNDYRQFFHYLGKVLPCKYCRRSYQQFVKELPIDNYLHGPND